jgi:hypothetical protein
MTLDELLVAPKPIDTNAGQLIESLTGVLAEPTKAFLGRMPAETKVTVLNHPDGGIELACDPNALCQLAI